MAEFGEFLLTLKAQGPQDSDDQTPSGRDAWSQGLLQAFKGMVKLSTGQGVRPIRANDAVPFAAGVRLSLHANTKVVQQLAESYMQAIGPDPSAGMLLQQPLEYLSQFQAQLGLNPCNPSDDKRVLQLGLRPDDKQGLNPELQPAHVLRLVPSPWQRLGDGAAPRVTFNARHTVAVAEAAVEGPGGAALVRCSVLEGALGLEGRHYLRLRGEAAAVQRGGVAEHVLVGVCAVGPNGRDAVAVDVCTGGWWLVTDAGSRVTPEGLRALSPPVREATSGPFDLRLEIELHGSSAPAAKASGNFTLRAALGAAGPLRRVDTEFFPWGTVHKSGLDPALGPKDDPWHLWAALGRAGDRLELLEHSHASPRAISCCRPRPRASGAGALAVSQDGHTAYVPLRPYYNPSVSPTGPAAALPAAALGQPTLRGEQHFTWRVSAPSPRRQPQDRAPRAPGRLLVGVSTAAVDEQHFLHAALAAPFAPRIDTPVVPPVVPTSCITPVGSAPPTGSTPAEATPPAATLAANRAAAPAAAPAAAASEAAAPAAASAAASEAEAEAEMEVEVEVEAEAH